MYGTLPRLRVLVIDRWFCVQWSSAGFMQFNASPLQNTMQFTWATDSEELNRWGRLMVIVVGHSKGQNQVLHFCG
jgi:hypothetical protein